MSEEDVKLEQEIPALEEEQVVAEQPAEAPTVDPIEEKARAQGWRPPEEFDEEGKEAVSAGEFLRRGEYFARMDRMSNEIRGLKKQLDKERQRGYDQALRDVEVQRREAIELGDYAAFEDLDAKYNNLRQERAEIERDMHQNVGEPTRDAIEFQDRNGDWFNANTPENQSMVTQAIKIEEYYVQSKPYLTEGQRLALVEKEMKDLYPHRFKNQMKKAPSKVEVATTDAHVRTGKVEGIRYEDLDDRQKAACETFLAVDPSLKVEDYLRSLTHGLKARNQL